LALFFFLPSPSPFFFFYSPVTDGEWKNSESAIKRSSRIYHRGKGGKGEISYMGG
jgi:hypothetical protein